MHIAFSFNNGLETVIADFGEPNIVREPVRSVGVGTKPIELVIKDGTPNDKEISSEFYIRTIKYAYMGVGNIACGKIKGLNISDTSVGNLIKENTSVHIDLVYSPEFIVNFDIAKDTIEEGLYYADSVIIGKNSKYTPLITKDLLNPNMSILRGNHSTVILLVSSFNLPYVLESVVKDGYQSIVIKERFKDGSIGAEPVFIEDIKDRGVASILKYALLLAFKGTHLTITYINGKGLSTKVINCLIELTKSFAPDNMVYLYNTNNTSLDVDKLYLPNIA